MQSNQTNLHAQEAATRSGSVELPYEQLIVRNVTKTFPGTLALSHVSMSINAGEIRGLIGGNGSGKSTLIKIISGVHRADPGGDLTICGESVAADEITAAIAHKAGVRVVHQDLGIMQDLTVAENIALGHGFPTRVDGSINWRALHRYTDQLLERAEIAATPRTVMRRLSRAVQTEVVIARALRDQDSNGGILILDEPTTALPAHEVGRLMDSLRRSAARGQTIIFIGHRLDELLALTDRVTALRDGRVVNTASTAELDEGKLFEFIVGHKFAGHKRTVSDGHGDEVLAVENLWAGPLRGISLDVKAGEILGVAGLLGAGRTELLRTIFGDLPIRRGKIRFKGKDIHFRHPDDAKSAGIAFVPEDRREAVFVDLSLESNIEIASLELYWRGLRMHRHRMREDGRQLMEKFGVKAASSSTAMSTLSGGNQQKVILARWLRREPQLLLLDEPSQGVDIGARNEIYAMISDAVRRGAAAIVVASDLEELAHVADRAVVIRDGQVTTTLDRDDLSAHALNAAIYAGGNGA